jgi:hypothetical protein
MFSGVRVHHDWDAMVEQSSLPHGSQEAVRENTCADKFLPSPLFISSGSTTFWWLPTIIHGS